MIAIENMTDEQLNHAGKLIAARLGLKRSKNHKDRWQLFEGWGDKTNKGLVLSLKEMIRRFEMGEEN